MYSISRSFVHRSIAVYLVDMYDTSRPTEHLDLSTDNEDHFMAAFSIKFDNEGRRLLAGYVPLEKGI